MNTPTHNLDELSITYQRLLSCSKDSPIKGVHKEVLGKLELNIMKALKEQSHNLEDLSKAHQRVASVSGDDNSLSNVLLCKISEQL